MSEEALAHKVVLDLGNDVGLQLTLIRPGEFMMGTMEPEPINQSSFRIGMLQGILLAGCSLVVFMVSVFVVIAASLRKRHALQFTLGRSIVLMISGSMCILGSLHWYAKSVGLNEAQEERRQALNDMEVLNCPGWGMPRNDASAREKPARKVSVEHPFYMSTTEITQEQFERLMELNPSDHKGPALPVTMVSWYDAKEFCRKLSAVTGREVRLPSEVEWEYACRAGVQALFQDGVHIDSLTSVAWFRDNSNGQPQDVGLKRCNAWGLHDMTGNVWEWCEDTYRPYWQSSVPPAVDVTSDGPRVIRGGAFNSEAVHCRCAARAMLPGDSRSLYVGFRIVVSAVVGVRAQRDCGQTK